MTEHKSERPRIVVGVDGSEASKNALRWAARLATALGADVDAILVWEFYSTYGWSALVTTAPPPPELVKEIDTIVDDVFGDTRPAGLRTRVLEGGAAECLLSASHGAQLVVVGSRGHGGFVGLLLGSVSAKVAEHATCPVLVVHGDAAVSARAA